MSQQRLVLFVLGAVVAVIVLFEAIQVSTTTSSSANETHLQLSLRALHAKLDLLTNHSTMLEQELATLRKQYSLPEQRQQLSSGAGGGGAAQRVASDERRFHFVFSADCRYPPKVHWQSVVLLYSFFSTQEESSVITEVLSCHKADWKPHWHDFWTPEERLRVKYHVAPAHNPHPVTKDEYAPYNKPSALLDWVTKSGPEPNDIVVMIDWDNIILRPFPRHLLTSVQNRKPYASLYGIGVAWAYNNITNPNVCPWCWDASDEVKHGAGAAGSPHAWTASDFREVLPLWLAYTEKIRQEKLAREAAGWMAEMYGYLIGAMQLKFKHTTDASWMLSSSHPAEWTDDLVPPLVLHYCQTYYIGEWHFYKYDISAYDALGCDFPQLLPPPRDVSQAATAKTGDIWIAHTAVMYVNEAFKWFKQRACVNGWPGLHAPRWQPQPDHIGEYANGRMMERGP